MMTLQQHLNFLRVSLIQCTYSHISAYKYPAVSVTKTLVLYKKYMANFHIHNKFYLPSVITSETLLRHCNRMVVSSNAPST